MITEKNNVFYCDCGFSFQRGRSGSHDCADGLRNKLAEYEARYAPLAAENAGLKDFVKTCFRAAADGASLDGADIQELGERLGLFGRETYQPALHGYICGHEAGEDSVYVMKKTPATDAFLAEVRAQGADECVRQLVTSDDDDFSDAPNVCAEVVRQFRKGVQS
ncbi:MULTISPECIES: hypothetical protein [Enterobacter cloacae complex]|uniref:hypothetical protein n=1 Tax=Enterobacter cloacae complex TaxID=354276 RepID=UPI0004456A9E|nr:MULTISPECIES: hypothetical protein [Enterobacter cloacae complex]AWR69429.1 hypothetical protein CUN65_14170 [Enterobacter hormaechei subsp. xiangfangensis]AXM00227.1 hypothetical protein DF208_14120 [Enterobacter hormaechei subsp. xiangfangensis]EHK3214151.1 hypothetical protein [Enterobacter hormaechei]EHK3218723.1 hypothetical protein [Enterobacter hormaechei]EHK3223701.1 hypothetical protein [Enterobacter hormaechei]